MLAFSAPTAYDLGRLPTFNSLCRQGPGNCMKGVRGLTVFCLRGTILDLLGANEIQHAERAPVSQDDMHGYTVAYEREEIQFPVYVVGFIGAVLATVGVAIDNVVLIALSLFAFGFAYYNYPLLETGKPRIGAGQYGIFAEGLGVLGWGAIKQLELIPIDIRGATSNELHITLEEPLEEALLADWRPRPFYRHLMRLPWAARGDIIRIPLDVFDRPADEIMHSFERMMAFYRR
jgi:hypothetical protein